jgi:hypothetical protein
VSGVTAIVIWQCCAAAVSVCELDQSSGDRSVATRTPTRRERRRSPVQPHVGLIEQANENLLQALLRERQMVPENVTTYSKFGRF